MLFTCLRLGAFLVHSASAQAEVQDPLSLLVMYVHSHNATCYGYSEMRMTRRLGLGDELEGLEILVVFDEALERVLPQIYL